MTFAKCEEGDIWTKTCNDAEIGDESDDDSIMTPILSKKEMDAMNYDDESDHGLIYEEMLETIRDRSQTHPHFNKRVARYKTIDHKKAKTIGMERSVKSYVKHG